MIVRRRDVRSRVFNESVISSDTPCTSWLIRSSHQTDQLMVMSFPAQNARGMYTIHCSILHINICIFMYTLQLANGWFILLLNIIHRYTKQKNTWRSRIEETIVIKNWCGSDSTNSCSSYDSGMRITYEPAFVFILWYRYSLLVLYNPRNGLYKNANGSIIVWLVCSVGS